MKNGKSFTYKFWINHLQLKQDTNHTHLHQAIYKKNFPKLSEGFARSSYVSDWRNRIRRHPPSQKPTTAPTKSTRASARALPLLQPPPPSPRAGDELRSTCWPTPTPPPPSRRLWLRRGTVLRCATRRRGWRETRRWVWGRKEIKKRRGKESESCAARALSTANLPMDD